LARLDTRLELRLDKATFEQLERQAAAGHVSVAQLVRRAIARELEGSEGSWRAHALERGLSLDVPVPSDPAALARELDALYGTEGWTLDAPAPRPGPAASPPGAPSAPPAAPPPAPSTGA
jgi:hypothetical protein